MFIRLNLKIICGLIFSSVLIYLIGCAQLPRLDSTNGTSELIWPPPPETPRIKWLHQWSSKYDFGGGPSQLMGVLLGPEKVEKMLRPNGVVADNAGNVYVADSAFGKIFVFDIEKQTLRTIGKDNLARPIGLAIDNKRGIIFASDSKIDRVYGLDKNNGRVLMTIGTPGEFKNPAGMAYDEERERLYVCDARNHMVKVFDKDGKPLFSIGKKGTGNGEFNVPSYVALDRQGRIYVTDSFNGRVQIFDPDGNFIRKFGRLGDQSGQFSRPHGIGVDSENHVYVVDAAFSNFQIFNEDGKLLLWIGKAGRKPGEFYLPTGLYIDKQDRIYVTDTFNYRVQVFQYLKENK